MIPARRKLDNIVRHLSPEKLHRLLEYASDLEDELTPDDIATIEAGKAQIASGESVSLNELKRRYGL